MNVVAGSQRAQPAFDSLRSLHRCLSSSEHTMYRKWIALSDRWQPQMENAQRKRFSSCKRYNYNLSAEPRKTETKTESRARNLTENSLLFKEIKTRERKIFRLLQTEDWICGCRCHYLIPFRAAVTFPRQTSVDFQTEFTKPKSAAVFNADENSFTEETGKKENERRQRKRTNAVTLPIRKLI